MKTKQNYETNINATKNNKQTPSKLYNQNGKVNQPNKNYLWKQPQCCINVSKEQPTI